MASEYSRQRVPVSKYLATKLAEMTSSHPHPRHAHAVRRSRGAGARTRLGKMQGLILSYSPRSFLSFYLTDQRSEGDLKYTEDYKYKPTLEGEYLVPTWRQPEIPPRYSSIS
jgi:hypothetical protein